MARLKVVVIIVLSLLLTGNAFSTVPSWDSASISPATNSLVAYLIWCIRDARNYMETQVYSTKDSSQQVYILASKLKDIESKLEEIEKWSSVGSSGHDASQIYQSEAFDNTTRITLLGARALTEFKAQELYRALDSLTDKSQNKHAVLAMVAEKAEALSEEVTKIKGILKSGIYPRKIIIAGEGAQVNAVGPRIQGRSIQFKQATSEGDQPTVVRMTGATDVNQLKSTKQSLQEKAGGNSEAEFSPDELKKRMDEVTKQAKALQQIVSEVIQKAESIKKQEKITDSKLSDMRQLKKSWEIKKIPVNKEIEAVENKLNNDMLRYQETLKEVNMLKQFLTSMFNGILRTEPETRNR